MQLRIFTDLKLLKLGYPVELLVPFVGKINKEDMPGKIMSTRFDDYISRGKELFSLTSIIEDADICLLPIYYKVGENIPEFENAIESFVQKVENSNKKIIIFIGHEVYTPKFKIKNCIIFNSAVNKSKQPKNTFAWPYFFEDFIKQYYKNELVLREKKQIPILGFCGFAPLELRFGKAKLIGTIKLVANYLGLMKFLPSKASHSYRARAILGLRKTKLLQPNIKVKSSFAFGPAGQLNTNISHESDEIFRRNFVNNIIESDYTLAVRGIGNNSIRFFESLCCGRIPVLLNTDCVLPFDHIIDWKSLCVWVEEKDIDKIDEVVFEFHSKISPEDFISLQRKLRAVWEEFLSPVGFFKNLRVFIETK